MLKSGKPEARVEAMPPATLSAEWRFPVGTLRLTARFAPEPEAIPPKEQPLFAIGDAMTEPSFALWISD